MVGPWHLVGFIVMVISGHPWTISLSETAEGPVSKVLGWSGGCQRGLVTELLEFSKAEPMEPLVGTYLCFVFHPYDMTANKGIYPIEF